MGWLAQRSQHARLRHGQLASVSNQDRFTAWAIQKMGGFSVYREGMDRKAIETAIDILARAERPLILFPEGRVTRTNDKLSALLDGVAFIARSGAQRRQKLVPNGQVVIHPVAIKYRFRGDLAQTFGSRAFRDRGTFLLAAPIQSPLTGTNPHGRLRPVGTQGNRILRPAPNRKTFRTAPPTDSIDCSTRSSRMAGHDPGRARGASHQESPHEDPARHDPG